MLKLKCQWAFLYHKMWVSEFIKGEEIRFKKCEVIPAILSANSLPESSLASGRATRHCAPMKCWSRTYNGSRLSTAAALLRRSGRLLKQAQQVPGLRPVPGKHPVTISFGEACRETVALCARSTDAEERLLWRLHWKDEEEFVGLCVRGMFSPACITDLKFHDNKICKKTKNKKKKNKIPDLFHRSHITELRYIPLHAQSAASLATHSYTLRDYNWNRKGWTTVLFVSRIKAWQHFPHTQTYPGDLEAGSGVRVCLLEPDKLSK